MNTGIDTIGLLNEVLRLLTRGLPSYLAEAPPWYEGTASPYDDWLDLVVRDFHEYAGYIAKSILSLGGTADAGPYSMIFTSINDNSWDYFGPALQCSLHDGIAVLENIAEQLKGDETLHPLIEEILGNFKGHLFVLEQRLG